MFLLALHYQGTTPDYWLDQSEESINTALAVLEDVHGSES